MNTIIRCKNLNVSYGALHVLQDINLEVQKGEAIGIMGPNGSGKTTLLKVMLGNIKPTTGDLRIFDCSCEHLLCHHRSKIGYLPQKASIDPRYPLTVLEATMMGRYSVLGLFKRPSKKDVDICMKMLSYTNMDSFADKPIGQLSGGQQQRVFIARALTQDPDILLLDEPTTGLDVPSQSLLLKTVKDLHRSLKLTILFITHEINLISGFVDRIVLLNKKIYAMGKPEEILTRDNLSKIYGDNIHISKQDDGYYVFTGDHHV